MADFGIAYRRTAKWEGGYQASPDDPGNYNSLGQLVGTNWGVSAKKYERLLGRPPTKEQVREMPQWRAEQAFRNDEWKRMKGDEIPHQPLADILFDGLVNHGRGVKLLQEVLGITADNVFGQQTLNAVLAANPQELYSAYRERRRQYYRSLVQRDPKLKVFLKGWLRRIDSFTDTFANTVKENPGASVATVFGIGAAIYFLTR
jgi:lysozyme family protein